MTRQTPSSHALVSYPPSQDARTPVGGKWRFIFGCPYLGGSSHLGYVVRMGPPCISHEARPFVRGPTTRSLGDLRSPWLLTTEPNWDDPPSSNPGGDLHPGWGDRSKRWFSLGIHPTCMARFACFDQVKMTWLDNYTVNCWTTTLLSDTYKIPRKEYQSKSLVVS